MERNQEVDKGLLYFSEHCQGRMPMEEKIIDGQTYYVFRDLAFPADGPTCLQNAPGIFYTLGAIVSCWTCRDMAPNTFVKEMVRRGIKGVTFVHKKKVLNYLESGSTDVLSLYVKNDEASEGISLDELLLNEHHEGPQPKRLRLERPEVQEVEAQPPVIEETPMEVDAPLQEDGIRALNKELDAEKIAQLRNRVKRKMKQSKTLLEEDQYDVLDILPFEDGSEDDVGKQLQQIEVPGCSRMGLYSTEGLDLEAVMEYMNEALGKKPRQQPPPNQRPNAPVNGSNPQKRPAVGYSRYDQEVFRQELDTDFHIDTDLSFHGSTLKTLNSRPLPGQLPPPNQTRPGFGPPTALHPNGKPPKRTSKTPIIVIPASGTALITMYNVEDILQDMRFVTSEERKKTKTKRESDLLIHRAKENGTTVPFRIIEDPRKLKDEDWDRVVAVFVQGPAWQFKGWRFGSQPTEIFARICAFHLKFDEQPLDKNVAQWSVNVLSLSQTKRHLDRAVLHKFWSTLDKYMVKNKPHLRF